MRGRLLLIVSLLLVAGFAPAPLPRARRAAPEDDLRKMQGTWVVTKYERDGSDGIGGLGERLRITFRGDRMSFLLGEDVRSTWRFELSPRSSPRAFTRANDDRSHVVRGIYRFEGDRLIICDNHNGPRPTEFDSRGGRWLIEMRRQ